MKIYLVLIHVFFIHLIKGHDNQYIVNYIKNLNYNVEVYKNVTTKDEYILTMFRINRGNANFKGVALFVHGLLASGEFWFINYPNKTLPFQLADNGYDVWIGNDRGCYHSLKHVYWHSSNPVSPYWNYSFHELGVYDLPAMIDFTLGITGFRKLIYIGFGQGTTAFFAMASSLPKYNDKIAVMFALAPAAFMSHAKSPILLTLGKVIGSVPGIELSVGNQGITFYDDFLKTACSGKVNADICTELIFSSTGFDHVEFDEDLLPRLLRQYPDGVSFKQLIHYSQLAYSGYFRQYSYTRILNRKHYGSAQPPSYDLSKITCKVELYYASNDWFSAVEDVKNLHDKLPNSEMNYVNYIGFNHVDYMMAKSVNELVYNLILKQITAIGNIS